MPNTNVVVYDFNGKVYNKRNDLHYDIIINKINEEAKSSMQFLGYEKHYENSTSHGLFMCKYCNVLKTTSISNASCRPLKCTKCPGIDDTILSYTEVDISGIETKVLIIDEFSNEIKFPHGQKTLGMWANEIIKHIEKFEKTFIGFKLDNLSSWKGNKTDYVYLCNRCGEYETMKIANLLLTRFCTKTTYREIKKIICPITNELYEYATCSDIIVGGKTLNPLVIQREVEEINEQYDVIGFSIEDSFTKLYTHVLRTCEQHGIFKTTIQNIFQRNDGCPGCKIKSKAAEEISNYFAKNNIRHKEEVKFDDCRNIRPLPFDFMIDKNTIIEYDGIQHFQKYKFFGDDAAFEVLKNNDGIKTEYAINNGYNFIRIAYYEDHIAVLQSFLKLIVDNPGKQIVQNYGDVQILDKK